VFTVLRDLPTCRRASCAFTKPGRIRASCAERFQRISGQGFPVHNWPDLCTLGDASQRRKPSAGISRHRTPDALTGSKAFASRRIPRSDPGRQPDVRAIFSGFSSDFRFSRQSWRCAGQGYVYGPTLACDTAESL